MKICTVESFTGGLMAKEITDIPGSSSFFVGGMVAYSNDVKEKLGIDTSNGVINKSVALEMSEVGRKYFGADLCIAFTGNAGPTSMEDKPVGHVFIAINDEIHELHYHGSRSEIRAQAVKFAMHKIKKFIK